MRVSVIFETKAILPPQAPDSWNLPYLNLVVAGKSALSPHALLTTLKSFEKQLGRDLSAPRWSPRIIDLDILAWGDQTLRDEELTLPHRELINRPFLLILMASLCSNWRYPVPGLPYSHLTLDEILHHHIKFQSPRSRCFLALPQLVGIVNITPDSFSDGGKYFQSEKAIQKIQELELQGAAVIDIGAQSTRPETTLVSTEEEWRRLRPVLDFIAQHVSKRPAKPLISLDSCNREIIKRALKQYPIDWINDVSGGKDVELLRAVAETNCKIVINHSLTVPASSTSVLPFDHSPLFSLACWAEEKIQQLERLGIAKDRIILDPGVGFGKTSFQSLSLLRKIAVLKKIGGEILVGHSRKSFLKIITNAEDRDWETLGVSHFLLKEGVDYLRVHHIEAHHRSLTASAWLGEWHDF